MDKDTLVAALVGALIATIPILISNLVQIYLHVSENRRKDKETREKWIERDVLKVMDLTEKLLTLISQIRSINIRIAGIEQLKRTMHWTDDEARKEYKSTRDVADGLIMEANQTKDLMGIVYSFDEPEIISAYLDLEEAVKISINSPQGEILISLREKAGKLQKALRNKLISIRE
jgi:hypothetical protein